MSLREFIESEEFTRIEQEVSTRLEITKYLKENKPILLEKIKGYPSVKVVGNVIYSRETAARAIGTNKHEIINKFLKCLDNPMKYSYKDSADFMENIVKNPDIIKQIPLTVFFEEYERYYTTATIVLARDPETDRMNASFHRLMYLGGRKFAIRLVPRDLYSFYIKNKEKGRDTPIAIICGVHPAISIAAATSYPDLNELELANSFLNGKLECIDLNGIDIPAEVEVVMYGRILHNEEADEGPFVDLTGTWDIVRRQPVVEIDELYFRKNPIWQVILPGGIEHKLLMGIPQEPRIFKIVKNAIPTVKNVVLTEGGCCWLHAAVSIRKLTDGDGKTAGLAALAAHPSLKAVVVVDDDVDITNPQEVEWAVATRLVPSKGVIIIPEAKGSTLDPSSAKRGVSSKLIIDATIPLDRDRKEFEKVY